MTRIGIILFSLILFSATVVYGSELAEQPVVEPVIVETIPELITRLALENNIEPATALRICNCESGFNPLAKNSHSSATGLFQFLDGTWNAYCQGDRLNANDNAQCFMQLYLAHPSWWVCR